MDSEILGANRHKDAFAGTGQSPFQVILMSLITALCTGVLTGILSFAATSQTNATALEVVRQTARESNASDLARLDRDRKEAAYLAYINAVDRLHDLRQYQWWQEDMKNIGESGRRMEHITLTFDYPSYPPPAESEDKLRNDVRDSANSILLVIDPSDYPLVETLSKTVQLNGLRPPPPAPEALNTPTLENAFQSARLAFVNAYRQSVLALDPIQRETASPNS